MKNKNQIRNLHIRKPPSSSRHAPKPLGKWRNIFGKKFIPHSVCDFSNFFLKNRSGMRNDFQCGIRNFLLLWALLRFPHSAAISAAISQRKIFRTIVGTFCGNRCDFRIPHNFPHYCGRPNNPPITIR